MDSLILNLKAAMPTAATNKQSDLYLAWQCHLTDGIKDVNIYIYITKNNRSRFIIKRQKNI
jgi:hypothetical protein